MIAVIKCKRCGREVPIDDYDIQFCQCGVYYRRKRGFHIGWTIGGNWRKGINEPDFKPIEKKKKW